LRLAIYFRWFFSLLSLWQVHNEHDQRKREGRWGARETGIERDGPPVVTGNCPSYPVIHVPHAAVETRAKVATDIACFGACCRRTARNTIKTFKNFEKMFKNSISEPKCFRMTLCLLFV